MASGESQPGRGARHIALPQIGTSGQAGIEKASILLVGLGGIGCAAASYLASSGVGKLLLNDFDTVDETNLGRQFLYGPADTGKPKVSIAAQRIHKMNPDIDLIELPDRLDKTGLAGAISKADVVLDGCDNFATRFLVNEVCVESGTMLVSGSAIRFEGQIVVFGGDFERSPCYRCLYSEADESLDDCAGNGVYSPVPGMVGTLMAAEAMKHLAGLAIETGRLQVFDGLANEWKKIVVPKRESCSVCA